MTVFNLHQGSKVGHVSILGATLLAATGLIILTVGAVGSNVTLVWVGGIATAILSVVQFFFIHQEINSLWRRIDELEQNQK